jgi:two-component system, chemotaxis family, protein-glutamate methylesterase/glutaminase
MPKHDIIVVGASAGGITALTQFIKALPKDFKPSIFIVLHLAPHSPSYLAHILTSAGVLKARTPTDGEQIQQGMIYVAPPDHHMLLEARKVLVKKGPKENRFRPSIDALFRSAAYVYGPRVVGIVLSGLLNDGTSGLWTIKRMGGICIVQEPDDAEYPSMPMNALEYVEADHIVPAAEIPAILNAIQANKKKPKLSIKERQLLEMEITIAREDNAFEMGILNMGEFTPFTCPECNGVLIRLVEGKFIRFRCHTGHAFTASALLAEVTKTVEDKLWQGMRGLEETAMLLDKISEHFDSQGSSDSSRFFKRKAASIRKRARTIHDSVFQQEQISEDLRFKAPNTIVKKRSRKKKT